MKKLFSAVIAVLVALPLSAATFQEVNKLIKEKKWSDAEVSCRQLISEVKKDNDKYLAYMKLMIIMRRLNKNAELIKDADTFLAECKNDKHAADLLIYKGIGQRSIKEYASALDSFKLAVDKAKEGNIAREAAFYYMDTAPGVKKFAEAQEMYQRVKSLKDVDKDARLLLGASYIYWYNNKYDEAWEILELAGKIENLTVIQKETLLRYRGNIMYNTKKYDEALKYFDQALALEISSYNACRINYYKAQTLEKLKRYEDAVAAYKAVLEYKEESYFKRASAVSIERISKKIKGE